MASKSLYGTLGYHDGFKGGFMVALTSTGEVAEYLNESQFQGGLTAYACVAFAASLLKYSAQPGHSITGTNAQVAATAFEWYQRLEGSDLASNTNGMSLQAEYTMLQGLGLRYHPVPSNFLVYIKAWLALGYPLLICGAETGMHDLDMGDAVPYSWTPTGNHAIVASGIASDGNLLVRDTASIAPTGVRPGPRRYDISKLQLISATAVGMPWLPVLPSNFDPTKEGTVSTLDNLKANGWKDDGTTLTAPNGVPVVLGFRSYVLANNWDPNNLPVVAQYYISQLEVSNPALGPGDQQPFYDTLLGYPHAPQAPWEGLRGKVIVEYVGKELVAVSRQVSLCVAQIKQLQAQLAAQPPAQNPQAGQALVDMQQIKAIAGKY